MVNQQIAMAWWLRFILVGLISFFYLGLVPSGAMAALDEVAPVVESNPTVQPNYHGANFDGATRDGATLDSATSYPVIPTLTNPAEIPVAETPTVEIEPSLTSSLAWLHEAIQDTQSPEPVNDSQGKGNASVKQWLSSINSVLEGK